MNDNISFSSSIYLEQETREDEELLAFTRAVADVFGSQEARLSERDWLTESDSMDTPPISIARNWRAVSIAASFHLAPEQNTNESGNSKGMQFQLDRHESPQIIRERCLN